MIAWLVVALIVWGLYALAQRLHRLRKATVSERSHRHEIALEMIDDWITDQDITKALVTTGTVTQQGLDQLPNWLSTCSEKEVWGTVAALTRDRRARRVIADHLSSKLKIPKEGAMKALMEMREAGGGNL